MNHLVGVLSYERHGTLTLYSKSIRLHYQFYCQFQLPVEKRVNGMLKCKHFKSQQAMLRITNPHYCFHLRRTSEPLKSQGINQILAMGMTSHKTLPRWCLRWQPSGSPGMPLISPTPSQLAFFYLEASRRGLG